MKSKCTRPAGIALESPAGVAVDLTGETLDDIAVPEIEIEIPEITVGSFSIEIEAG